MRVWIPRGLGIIAAIGLFCTTPAGAWKGHTIRQMNGWDKPLLEPAQFQIVTESWNRVAAVPYIVYMPEKDQVLMLVNCDFPHQTMVLASTDHGATWSEPYLEGSCRYYGTDVQTWVKEGLVDYICPSLFLGQLPGLPMTREFADLTKGTEIGVYPTLNSLAGWMHDTLGVERSITLDPKDRQALALYKYELCNAALRMYQDGADGISSYNWYSFFDDPDGGPGPAAIQRYIFPFLNDPEAIRNYLDQPWAIPPH